MHFAWLLPALGFEISECTAFNWVDASVGTLDADMLGDAGNAGDAGEPIQGVTLPP